MYKCPKCGSKVIVDKSWDDDQEIHFECTNCDFDCFDGEIDLEEFVERQLKEEL